MKMIQKTAAALFVLLAVGPAFAAEPRETWFEDLVPQGAPAAQIIGEGEMNRADDTWKPQYDANAIRFNDALDGALVRMPGYIVPMGGGSDGVTSFLLVPYVGACLHVPAPPANQIVFVATETPWPNDSLWDPVWVTGTLKIQPLSTELAEVGYTMQALAIAPYTEQ
jgi:hypothetical protein